jgi:hypothetical protein
LGIAAFRIARGKKPNYKQFPGRMTRRISGANCGLFAADYGQTNPGKRGDFRTFVRF